MPSIYGTNTSNQLGTKAGVKGIASQYGLDPKGDNEFGALFRRASIGMAPDFLNRVGFANEIGPQRIQAIRDYISRFSPGNVQATADQYRNMLAGQGVTAGLDARNRVAGAGGSQDAQLGAQLAQQGMATRAGNAYQMDLNSPMGQAKLLQQLIGAFNEGGNLNLDQLMQMSNVVENRSATNRANKQKSGLGGTIGSLLGQIAPLIGGPAGMAAGAVGGGMAGGGIGGGIGGQVSPDLSWLKGGWF